VADDYTRSGKLRVIHIPTYCETKCYKCGGVSTWRAVDRSTGRRIACPGTAARRFALESGWSMTPGRGKGWTCPRCVKERAAHG
jgi:hypothetical protein